MRHHRPSPARCALVLDRRFEQRIRDAEHPEDEGRLVAIRRELEQRGLVERCLRVKPRPATTAELAVVHPPEHLNRLASAHPAGALVMARFATGATIDAMDAVLQGRAARALALIRPPGHHASPCRTRGFCFYNHAAVAARLAVTSRGLSRVAIVDWDVHHGNGTQDAVYDDPRVAFVSLHREDGYPGTGHPEARGEGPAHGTNLNIPLPRGSANRDYLQTLEGEVEPKLQRFGPQLLIVSAGYDAYYLDDLGLMRLTAEGYAQLTRWACQVAGELCEHRLLLILEGGYHPQGLARSVAASLEVCLDRHDFPAQMLDGAAVAPRARPPRPHG